MSRPVIDVAVAVVRNAESHVLLAERTPRQVAAGFWELPGGKIEAGEAPAQAASRELLEETGLVAGQMQKLMTYDHVFPTKTVRLHIFLAPDWQGSPAGREGQRLAWADPDRPHVTPILPSNHRVLRALGLPARIEIIDLDAAAPLARAQNALSAGARHLLLRGTGLSPDQRVAIARRICQSANGARVLLAGSMHDAARAGATGLHSEAAALRRFTARPPVLLWSVACHGEDDVRRAEMLGADLVITPAAPEGPLLRASTRSGLPIYGGSTSGQTSPSGPRGAPAVQANVKPVPHPWMMRSGATAAARFPRD